MRNWYFFKGKVPIPDEYQDYLLCKDVYRCLPSELDQEDAETVAMHWEMYCIDREETNKQHGGKRMKGKPKRVNRGR